MIDFKQQVSAVLAEKLAELASGAGLESGLSQQEIVGMLEIPPNSEMGDFAFPCFRLAKTMRKAPNLIAEDLVKLIGSMDLFEKVESKGGYANFFIDTKTMTTAQLT